MMRNLYFILITFCFIISSCASPTPTAPTASPPFKVTMTSDKIISNGPIYIADSEGYFAEQNIEIEIIPFDRSSAALPLIATGEIDVYNGGFESGAMVTVASDENIAVVADKGHFGSAECSYYGLMLRQDLFDSGEYTRSSDLKGLTIATTTRGTAGYLLTRYLAQDGLTLDDIVVVEVPRAAYLEAFANKSIDAATVPDPYLSQVAASGEASLWLRPEDVIGGFQVAIVAFGPKLIKDYPDFGVKYMTAYLKGVKQFNTGKTERNVEIITEYTQLTRDDVVNSCWPPINEDGKIDFASIEDYIQWNVEAGFLDQPVTEDQLWNPYFVEQAYAVLNK